MSYAINHTHSGAVTEITADDDTAATAAVLAMLGRDVVIADQWDADGTNDDGVQCWRRLIWEDESSSENDDGANAVASLTRVGGPRE